MTTREEDVLNTLLMPQHTDYLLFFTNKGRVFRIKHMVPASLTAKSVAIVNLLQLQPEEKLAQ